MPFTGWSAPSRPRSFLRACCRPMPNANGTARVASAQSGAASASEQIAPPAAGNISGSGDSVLPAPLLDDPGMAYTNEVKTALIDAMLDFGPPIPLGEAEWLTIAARDNDDSRLGGGDPYDVSTIVLRIRGVDLASYRAKQITRDDALKRVEVREY